MPPDDKLIIETPEQTVLEFRLAGIGSRALALAIDSLLESGVTLVTGLMAGAVAYSGVLPQMGKQWAYAILIICFFVLQFGYFAFFETIWNGQTPGKRWVHLRVIMDSGRPIGPQEAILRNLVRIVDTLPGLYAAGIITSLLSAQNKRIGDYVAGTVVVLEKPLERSGTVWTPSAHPSVSIATYRTLTAGELQLIEAFLERRAACTPDVRRSMARQIAERLNFGAAGAAEVPSHDAESFLEQLAERHRNATRFR